MDSKTQFLKTEGFSYSRFFVVLRVCVWSNPLPPASFSLCLNFLVVLPLQEGEFFFRVVPLKVGQFFKFPLQYLFSSSINNSLSGVLLHFCALSFKTPPRLRGGGFRACSEDGGVVCSCLCSYYVLLSAQKVRINW